MTKLPVTGAPSARPVGLSRRGFLGLTLMSGAVTAGAIAIPLCSNCSGYNKDEIYMFRETDKVAPLTRSITARAQSRQEAVELVVQWAQNNLFHAYCSPPDECWWYAGNCELNKVSIEDVFRERAVGCHLASLTVITMLRSIGIYAEYIKEDQGRFVDSGHAVCHIPELQRYIHGDYIAELVGVPAHELLQTRDELIEWCSHPGFFNEAAGVYTFRGFSSFMAVVSERYGFTRDHINKRRRERALYLQGWLSSENPELGLATLAENCPEFVPQLGEEDPYGRIPFTSEHVPIRSLI
jgi:hypothetical protein